MSHNESMPEPMDKGAPEEARTQAYVNRPRVAYGVQTLIKEVTALFPETTYETSGVNGLNVSLNVTFAVHESPGLETLLLLTKNDERVQEITHDEIEGTVLVEFWPSARYQDLRDPFDLADAWIVMTESEDEEGMDLLDSNSFDLPFEDGSL